MGIKKFNQFSEKLKIDTYRSAIDKLKKMGHQSRSKKMENNLKRPISDHVFNFWIFDSTYIQGSIPSEYNGKNLSKVPIQGKLMRVDFDHDMIKDVFFDNNMLTISFQFKIDSWDNVYPKSDAVEMEEYENGYGLELISLQSQFNDPKMSNKFSFVPPPGPEPFMHKYVIKFSDRKSAIEFKKTLKRVLFNEIIHYGWDKDDTTDECITVSDSIRNFLLETYTESSLDDVHDFYYSLCNMSANLFYTEDGIWA